MDSSEWRDRNIENWKRILAPYRGRDFEVLEIGSWEGDSALFFWNFLGARVTCIDNWENPTLARKVAQEVEDNFDANTAGKPITKIKMDSTKALYLLEKERRLFDLVYVDGSHYRDQVMVDSCLAWRLLRLGGIMIWDDYRDYTRTEPDYKRPEQAINLFVEMQGVAISELEDTGQQLIVRRRDPDALQESWTRPIRLAAG
jgi:predicted O-methyltransferase YrrM